MDALGSYTPSFHKKYISSGEIQRMKKAMKKVPVLQLQSDIYHEKEVKEAESLLGGITEKENIPQNVDNIESRIAHHWWNRLIRYFTSLFTR